MTKYVFLGIAAATLLAGSATLYPQAPSYHVIDRNGDPLKAAFNADSGKTRVVMLVAPT